jgi:aldose 1-epimerase
VDDQLIPVAEEPVAGTPYDFSRGRVIGSTVLDDAFTDLVRDPQGRATVVLREPDGPGVALWVDERHHWLQAFSADAPAAGGRRSLAVEPMTAPADAFNSGRDLVTLAPAGQAGDELSASWGLYAL